MKDLNEILWEVWLSNPCVCASYRASTLTVSGTENMEKGIWNLYPGWDSPPKSTIFHRDSPELSIFSRQHQIKFYEALDYYESSDSDQIYGVLIPQWFSMPGLTVTTSLLHAAHKFQMS